MKIIVALSDKGLILIVLEARYVNATEDIHNWDKRNEIRLVSPQNNKKSARDHLKWLPSIKSKRQKVFRSFSIQLYYGHLYAFKHQLFS